MPLRINLYHEIAQQKRVEQRDPLKISGFVLGGIAACCAAYYFYVMNQTWTITSENDRLQSELNDLSPKAADSKRAEEQSSNIIKTADTVAKRIESRFYWGPVLDAVAKNVPQSVQLITFGGDIREAEGKRKVTISFNGLAAGREPRKSAEDFRTSMENLFKKTYPDASASFRSLEDGTETAVVGGTEANTAQFGIGLTFTFDGASNIGDPAPATAQASK